MRRPYCEPRYLFAVVSIRGIYYYCRSCCRYICCFQCIYLLLSVHMILLRRSAGGANTADIFCCQCVLLSRVAVVFGQYIYCGQGVLLSVSTVLLSSSKSTINTAAVAMVYCYHPRHHLLLLLFVAATTVPPCIASGVRWPVVGDPSGGPLTYTVTFLYLRLRKRTERTNKHLIAKPSERL